MLDAIVPKCREEQQGESHLRQPVSPDRPFARLVHRHVSYSTELYEADYHDIRAV